MGLLETLCRGRASGRDARRLDTNEPRSAATADSCDENVKFPFAKEGVVFRRATGGGRETPLSSYSLKCNTPARIRSLTESLLRSALVRTCGFQETIPVCCPRSRGRLRRPSPAFDTSFHRDARQLTEQMQAASVISGQLVGSGRWQSLRRDARLPPREGRPLHG